MTEIATPVEQPTAEEIACYHSKSIGTAIITGVYVTAGGSL